jgi:hypothetical protein
VNYRVFTWSIVAAFAIAGCSTSISSTKLTDSRSQTGIRYSLPQPFLMVTPASDGSISVDIVYLPDPTNEYIVTASSFLSSYDLTVATTNGMLKSVGYKQSDADVAAQIAQSAGNLVAAQQQAEAKQEQQRTSNIAAVQKSVDEAQAQLDKDAAILRTLQARGAATSADYAKVAADQTALKDAKNRLNAATASGGISAGNVPSPGFTTARAYGPMLYRIVATPDGVKLLAAPQEIFKTSAVTTASSTSSTGGASVSGGKFSIKNAEGNPPVVHRAGADRISLTVLSSAPLSKLGPLHLDAAVGSETKADSFIKRGEIDSADNKQIRIQLDAGIQDGEYVLSISATTVSGEESANDVSFKIAP